MNGVALTADVITGAKAGIADSFDVISDTVNNQYLVELAIMFIGVSVVVGFIAYMVKGHRKI